MLWLIVSLLLVITSLLFIKISWGKTRPAPLPPGPKGLPIVGNLFQMPTTRPWEIFADWGHTWGDIIYLNVLQQPIIIINSAQAAIDLLDKRGAIYSDRPRFPLAGELVGYEKILTLKQYGPESRLHRKLLHQYLRTRGDVERMVPILEFENRRFLQRLLDQPQKFVDHIRMTEGAIILKIAYGYQVQDTRDHLVKLNEDANLDFSELVAANYLVDSFPILKHIPAWVPGAGFQKRAIPARKICLELGNKPFDIVKQQMAEGTATPSFASLHLEQEELTPEREDIIKWAAAIIYGAGADDTVSTIHTFFLAMCLYPEIQKQAQAEIDRVVDSLGRLPTVADREDLPYVDALVKEVFRWNQVVPLGIPHRVCQDDVYDNKFIPQNSTIFVNIWKLLHDPHVYKDPMEFNPIRFIGETPEQDPRAYCFGFGRRVCAGSNLADASVFLSCAMTLAVFNISKATTTTQDGSVVEIQPEINYTSGIISHPAAFPCSIQPRSNDADTLIHSLKS